MPPDGELTLVLVLARSTTDFMLRKLQAHIQRESAGARLFAPVESAEELLGYPVPFRPRPPSSRPALRELRLLKNAMAQARATQCRCGRRGAR